MIFSATPTGFNGGPVMLPPVADVPGVPGNPTGMNNVPGGLTGGLDDSLNKNNAQPIIGSGVTPLTGGLDDSVNRNYAMPTNLVSLTPTGQSSSSSNITPSILSGSGSTSSSSASTIPGVATATGLAQGGGGGFATAPSLSTTSVAPSTATAQGGNSSISNIISGLLSSGDTSNIGALLTQILNIPNSTGAAPNTGIPSVSGAIPTTPTPANINTPFPANGIDNSGANPSGLDLGSLLGIKQNSNLPSQLDSIYGNGFGTTYANLLQSGGGFNPDINNALINQLRPQEARAFDNIRQTMANAGLSPSGSAFALASGDFWSQAANNENSLIANNFNQSLDRTYNLFGQGLSAAETSQANKMGPLQWLSALSPLLGPLVSGLASKIPNINVSTSSQGGTGTGTGGATTSTNTNVPTATGGQGGSGTGTGTAGGGSSTNTNTNANTGTNTQIQQQEQHQTQGAQGGGASSTIGFPGGQQVPATPGTTIPIPPGGMPTPTGIPIPAPTGGASSTVGFPGGPQVPATPGTTIPGTPVYAGPSNSNGGIVPPTPGFDSSFGVFTDPNTGNRSFLDPTTGQFIDLGPSPSASTIPTDLSDFGPSPLPPDYFGSGNDPFGIGRLGLDSFGFDSFSPGSGGGGNLLDQWNNFGGGGGSGGTSDLGGGIGRVFDEEM